MKKIILHTFISLAALLTVGTQHSKAQGFEWGLRDGITVASLVGIENTLPHIGLYAGLTTNYFFNERWGMGLDVTLSEQGAMCIDDRLGTTVDHCYHYANIPLMVNYRIPFENGTELRLLAGAQMGLFLVASYEYSAPSVLGDGYVEGSGHFDGEDFHPMDLGISLGLQWLVMDSPKLLIETRYTHGVTQTHDGISNTLNSTYYISVPNNRNSVFQLGTVLLF